jgi:hypothetical protein
MSKVSKPKQSSICCRNQNSRKYYYCWIKGTQHGLGYDREAADTKYGELLSGKSNEPETWIVGLSFRSNRPKKRSVGYRSAGRAGR